MFTKPLLWLFFYLSTQKTKTMGLSIAVFTEIEETKDDNDYDFTAYVIAERWESRIKHLKKDAYYKGDIQNSGISYSYSEHTSFRTDLLKLIGRNDLIVNNEPDWETVANTPDLPFYELIDFADNEGCLDFEISNKLFNDFEKYKDKVEKPKEGYNWSFEAKYYEWLRTFQDAKDNGVVVFR